MGLIIPRMPTKKEIQERINNGAKTLEEIDPEFFKYIQERTKHRLFNFITILTGIIILIIFLGIIIWPLSK